MNTKTLKVGTVCSGIGAPEAAWSTILRDDGSPAYEFVFNSEIEKFPCLVLAKHYPTVPNWGDMTKFEEWNYDTDIDVFIGGTPCQSFSVAGLRKGLDDPRGNLMLTFGAIAGRYRPAWLVWENVPGVLSSGGGQDFASFLGLLTGQAVKVPSEGWQNSGILAGIDSAYGVAWRVLDAQYFGVAQRRRRVFVVGHIGGCWQRAAAVLFERESLCGDSPPSRTPGKRTAPTISARTKGGGGLGTDFDCDGGRISTAMGEGFREQVDVAGSAFAIQEPGKRETQHGAGIGGADEPMFTLQKSVERGVFQPVECSSLSVIGFDTQQITSKTNRTKAEPGLPASTLNQAGQLHVALAFQERGRDGGSNLEIQTDLAYSLNSPNGGGRRQELNIAQPLAEPEDCAFPLSAGVSANAARMPHEQGALIPCGIDGGEVGFALRANASHSGDKGDGGVNTNLVAEGFRTSGNCGAWSTGDKTDALTTQSDPNSQVVTHAQRGRGFDGSEDGIGRGTPLVPEVPDVAYALQERDSKGSDSKGSDSNTKDGHLIPLSSGMAVRRLTPKECERLQGFPDDYTQVEVRGKSAADGPRYKALGNSMAVPVMHWIGKQILKVQEI